jgi:hypothetical protein
MTVIHKCAWCQKEFLPSDDKGVKFLVTHGLCESCRIDLEYKRIPLDDFINTLAIPVLVTDLNVNVTTANTAAEGKLNKKLTEFQGQLLGDVIECIYAELPGGCGEISHCTACALRNTVIKTYQTSENQVDVETFQFLKTPQGSQKVNSLISTQMVGDVVLVEIKSMTPELKNER